MKKISHIIKGLDQVADTFSYREALKVGIDSYRIRILIHNGLIKKIRRGIYKKVNSEDQGQHDSYIIASKKINQKNAVCLISALEYHHLTEQMPQNIWLLVDFNTRTTKEGVTLFRRRNPMWDLGIEKVDSFLVTDLERTIAESLYFKVKTGINEAYYGLEHALKQSKTDVSKIISIAKKLGYYEKIKSNLEPYIYG